MIFSVFHSFIYSYSYSKQSNLKSLINIITPRLKGDPCEVGNSTRIIRINKRVIEMLNSRAKKTKAP